MLKKVLIVLAALALVFIVVVMLQPSTTHVERAVVTQAPVAVVFKNINSLERFILWSPWQGMDPNQKVTFSGSKEGVGAKYEWVGNDQVGRGHMEIIESKPNEGIRENLEFVEPFASKAVVSIQLTPEAGATRIIWGFDTENGFMSKLFGMFVDMDEMLGKDFEKGLNSLVALSEKDAAGAAAAAPAAVEAGTADAGTAPAIP